MNSILSVFVFADVARSSYEELLYTGELLDNLERKLADEKAKHSDFDEVWFREEKIFPVQVQLQKETLVTIVFAAIAVEAFIYKYAAENLSSNFTKNYLDKLDTISKWVIIPQLVTGKKFPIDGQGFELLRKLIKRRNDIVHYKSPILPTRESLFPNLSIEEINERIQNLTVEDMTAATLGYDSELVEEWLIAIGKKEEIEARKKDTLETLEILRKLDEAECQEDEENMERNLRQTEINRVVAKEAIATLDTLTKDLESIDPNTNVSFYFISNFLSKFRYGRQ